MDNKYGLGSARVATVHHETHHKAEVLHATECHACGSSRLSLSLTMQDYLCADCGEWQDDIPQGYSTGRSSDY